MFKSKGRSAFIFEGRLFQNKNIKICQTATIHTKICLKRIMWPGVYQMWDAC